jgi:hypothetical protein
MCAAGGLTGSVSVPMKTSKIDRLLTLGVKHNNGALFLAYIIMEKVKVSKTK